MTVFHCKLEGETLIEAEDKVACYHILDAALPKGFHIAISEITDYGDALGTAVAARNSAYDAAQSVAQMFAQGLATEEELDKALTASRMAGKNVDHHKYLADQRRALETSLSSKGIFRD